MNAYFAIVSRTDQLLFEAEFFKADYLAKLEHNRNLHQFILHAALDMVQAAMWNSNAPYLKTVDRYGCWSASAFLAASGDRFMLLHDGKGEENVRQFFVECHELYTKYTLNPFYERDTPIVSGPFEVKVRLLGRKHLEK